MKHLRRLARQANRLHHKAEQALALRALASEALARETLAREALAREALVHNAPILAQIEALCQAAQSYHNDCEGYLARIRSDYGRDYLSGVEFAQSIVTTQQKYTTHFGCGCDSTSTELDGPFEVGGWELMSSSQFRTTWKRVVRSSQEGASAVTRRYDSDGTLRYERKVVVGNDDELRALDAQNRRYAHIKAIREEVRRLSDSL